jgi:hypothetical protein
MRLNQSFRGGTSDASSKGSALARVIKEKVMDLEYILCEIARYGDAVGLVGFVVMAALIVYEELKFAKLEVKDE